MKIEQSFVKYVLSGLNRWLWLACRFKPDDVICVDNDGVLALEPRHAQTETK